MSAANLSQASRSPFVAAGVRDRPPGRGPVRPSVKPWRGRLCLGRIFELALPVRPPSSWPREAHTARSCLATCRAASTEATRRPVLFPCPGGSAAYERSAAARSGGARGADGCFSIQAEGKADGLVSRQLHHSAVGPNRHPRSVAADEAHAHQLRRIRDRHPALRHAPDAVGKRGRLSRRGGAVGAGSAACLGRPRCLFWSFTMTN